MSNINPKAMFAIGYGLYVVTARAGKDNGCIANSVMQLTGEPLQVALSLNKSNYTYEQNTVISLAVKEHIDVGSHGLFICEVTEAVTLMDRPTMTYAYYHANVKPKPAAKGWVCKICGYKYEGEDLPPDFVCPWCKHPATDFEKI